MSDTAIVGVVGIVCATLLAPLVAYYIRRAEAARDDTINTIDGAIDAITAAWSSVAWAHAAVPRDGPLTVAGTAVAVQEQLRRALDDLHRLESYANRLHLRLGQHPMTEPYVKAHAALSKAAGWTYAKVNRTAIPLGLSPDDELRKANKLMHQFIEAARRWHDDEIGRI